MEALTAEAQSDLAQEQLAVEAQSGLTQKKLPVKAQVTVTCMHPHPSLMSFLVRATLFKHNTRHSRSKISQRRLR